VGEGFSAGGFEPASRGGRLDHRRFGVNCGSQAAGDEGGNGMRAVWPALPAAVLRGSWCSFCTALMRFSRNRVDTQAEPLALSRTSRNRPCRYIRTPSIRTRSRVWTQRSHRGWRATQDRDHNPPQRRGLVPSATWRPNGSKRCPRRLEAARSPVRASGDPVRLGGRSDGALRRHHHPRLGCARSGGSSSSP